MNNDNIEIKVVKNQTKLFLNIETQWKCIELYKTLCVFIRMDYRLHTMYSMFKSMSNSKKCCGLIISFIELFLAECVLFHIDISSACSLILLILSMCLFNTMTTNLIIQSR